MPNYYTENSFSYSIEVNEEIMMWCWMNISCTIYTTMIKMKKEKVTENHNLSIFSIIRLSIIHLQHDFQSI